MAPIVSRFSLKRVKRTYLYLGSILAPSPSVRWRLAGRSLPRRVAAVVQGFASQFPGFPLPVAPCVVACLTALTGLTANCTSPVPLCVPSERLGGVGVGVWVRVCGCAGVWVLRCPTTPALTRGYLIYTHTHHHHHHTTTTNAHETTHTTH